MVNKSKIDIISYIDNSHKCLYDIFFYPSYKQYLESNFKLHSIFIDEYSEANHFESDHWCKIILNRFSLLKEYIKKNKNKWAIFSDVDVIFFNNFYNDIEKFITNQTDYKIIYMPENNHSNLINGGFFLFFCDDEIYNWFQYIEENIKLTDRPNDQTFINSSISIDRPNFISLLDYSIFSCNNIHPNNIISFIKNKRLKVFHATSTPELLHKISILSASKIINDRFQKNKYDHSIIPNLWNFPTNLFNRS